MLGFIKNTETPMGDFRWLTVVSPEGKIFQKALLDGGIPLTCFGSGDVRGECERLRALGVVFRQEPAQMGPVTLAIFEDTRGNLNPVARQ